MTGKLGGSNWSYERKSNYWRRKQERDMLPLVVPHKPKKPFIPKQRFVEERLTLPEPPKLGEGVRILALIKRVKNGDTQIIALSDLRFGDHVVFGEQVYQIKAMELTGKSKSISLEQLGGNRIAIFDPYAVFKAGVTVIR